MIHQQKAVKLHSLAVFSLFRDDSQCFTLYIYSGATWVLYTFCVHFIGTLVQFLVENLAGRQEVDFVGRVGGKALKIRSM